jgi:branched-chain amino acid aminotransferase
MQQSLAFRDTTYLPKSEIKIGLDDLGFERGYGIFDYCRVRNGKIPFLSDHLERIDHSQSVLQLEQPASMPFIREVIEHLQSQNQFPDAYFKVIITGRIQNQVIQPIITVFQDMYKPYPESMYADGISLILEEYDKPFPLYKTTFYLGSFRQQTRMKMNGSEDVLFYFNDSVRECSRCNIFIVKNGLIYTPEKNLLWGVTRKHVIACAKQNTIVIEKDISVKELFAADEVFITSTTRNIMPVVKIEDTLIGNGKVGDITKQLMVQFETYCDSYAE